MSLIEAMVVVGRKKYLICCYFSGIMNNSSSAIFIQKVSLAYFSGLSRISIFFSSDSFILFSLNTHSCSKRDILVLVLINDIKLMSSKNVDDSLQPFLRSMLNISLKALLVISVLSMLGVEMTSFVAILGAAGLAVGLALSGTLQNFAGGVMILIFKPFEVGHVITAQGHTGSVFEIQILFYD